MVSFFFFFVRLLCCLFKFIRIARKCVDLLSGKTFPRARLVQGLGGCKLNVHMNEVRQRSFRRAGRRSPQTCQLTFSCTTATFSEERTAQRDKNIPVRETNCHDSMKTRPRKQTLQNPDFQQDVREETYQYRTESPAYSALRTSLPKLLLISKGSSQNYAQFASPHKQAQILNYIQTVF
jgi:hypothetical protein